jgi:glycolate oxidase iron-sulfur subunit
MSASDASSILTIGSVQHQIPVETLGPQGPGMARAVTTCVHCGFCLAACPTYKVLGEEMDSPRGRIVLMKQALEGELTIADALPYIDRCLGCLACETACPSGVLYRELVVPFRARAERDARPLTKRLARAALLATLESPTAFRLAVAAARFARPMSPVLPNALRSMIGLVPEDLPTREALPEHRPAVGTRRARVALLAGCVQQVLWPSINSATLRVLAAQGVEVVVPRGQRCCGALALHSGLDDRANALASHNARIFPRDVDAIITNAAGCGSAMKDGGFAAPVQDISEFLDALGLRTPLSVDPPSIVAYHDACHLGHGQQVRAAPRKLLEQIDNVTVVEIADGEMCCGSAGLYNLEHPDIAFDLGARKAAAIRATGANVVAAGNIGCLTQIASHLKRSQPPIGVRHLIEVLDSASTRALTV